MDTADSAQLKLQHCMTEWVHRKVIVAALAVMIVCELQFAFMKQGFHRHAHFKNLDDVGKYILLGYFVSFKCIYHCPDVHFKTFYNPS